MYSISRGLIFTFSFSYKMFFLSNLLCLGKGFDESHGTVEDSRGKGIFDN